MARIPQWQLAPHWGGSPVRGPDTCVWSRGGLAPPAGTAAGCPFRYGRGEPGGTTDRNSPVDTEESRANSPRPDPLSLGTKVA
jgi:hypothetical protein